MGRNRLTPAQESEAVASVASGEPTKAVARRYGVAYTTMIGILRRHRVSPKATDDPERLRQRERWKRNTRARRERADRVPH